MVSLDKSVLARLEKGGKRYEVLVNPALVEAFKESPEEVDLNDFLAMDEVFHDARAVSARLKKPSRKSLAAKTLWSLRAPF